METQNLSQDLLYLNNKKARMLTPNRRFNAQAIFCDFDGVIIDSEPYKLLGYLLAFQKKGIKTEFLLNRDVFEFYRKNCAGKSAEESCRNQLKWIYGTNWIHGNQGASGLDWREYQAEQMNFYQGFESNIPFIEPNINTLKKIKQETDVPFYIVTRSVPDKIDEILERAGLEGIEVLSAKEHGKQKYETAKKIVREEKFNIKDCIAIEDTSVGIQEANEQGFFTIAVPNYFTFYQDFAKADVCTKSLSELVVNEIRDKELEDNLIKVLKELESADIPINYFKKGIYEFKATCKSIFKDFDDGISLKRYGPTESFQVQMEGRDLISMVGNAIKKHKEGHSPALETLEKKLAINECNKLYWQNDVGSGYYSYTRWGIGGLKHSKIIFSLRKNDSSKWEPAIKCKIYKENATYVNEKGEICKL